MSEAENRVLIVGGTIGGLALALALRRVGLEAVVLERAPAPPESRGGGLHVWTNGARALRRLGLDTALRSVGEPVKRVQFRTPTDRVLMSVDVGGYARRWGDGSFFVSRADPPRALREALGDGVVRYGVRCVAIEQDAHGVTAVLEDGSLERGAVLVGADGIGSLVREQLGRRAKLRFAGYQDWGAVAVVELEHPSLPRGDLWTLWGRGIRVMTAHVGPGRVHWVASINRAPGLPLEPPEIGELCERFADWPHPVRQAVAATPREALYGVEIRDFAPLREWGSGRVTLLGDAAHATTPNLGRGAGEAFADAVVLAARLSSVRELADRAAVDAALRDYERTRRPQTTRVNKISRQIGELGKWESPLGAFARAQYLRAIALPTTRRMKRDFESGLPLLPPPHPAGARLAHV
jgi:2-polyprenyl-6-methoxyphenol hydroxylase-like FAD-dependent oxidoreductase